MTSARRAWAPLLAAAALLATACGSEAAPTGGGITRATPERTARATPPPTARAGVTATAVAPVTVDLALTRWGAALCAITVRFDDAVAAVQDGVDPSTLGLAIRLTRAQARYNAYLDALRLQAVALAALDPPPAAAPYHSAVRSQVSELERLFTEQLALLDRVVIVSEIEAATDTLQIEVEKLENSLALVLTRLPVGVRAALLAPARCSEILG